MHRPLALAALAAATLTAVTVQPPAASAAPVGYTRTTIAGNDLLYEIDVATGALTLVGDTNLEPATRALTLGPDGTLYGANDGDLVTVDTATGVATTVGPLGCCTTVSDMTFDASGGLWLLSGNPGNLYSVDVDTAAATLVGGLDQGVGSGLAADCAGNVYFTNAAADQLIRVDTANPGASSVVGGFGVDISSGSLAFDADGTLWMLTRPAVAGAPSQTFTVDPVSGSATLVAAAVAGNNPSDLALQGPACPDSEPAPTTTPVTTPGTTPATTPATTPVTAPPAIPPRPIAVTPRFAG